MEENEATTIHFNVGGQLYQVAQSLLEQYPSTMLYCAAAERWQTNPKSTIFIEGDGERFRYCLDYMRRQRVDLPVNIPKAAVLADLDYYGFPDVDPMLVNGISLADEVMVLHQTIKGLERKKEKEKLKKACLLLASELYAAFVRTGSLTVILYDRQRDDTELEPILRGEMDDNRVKILNDCLALYGLHVYKRECTTCIHSGEPWLKSVTLYR